MVAFRQADVWQRSALDIRSLQDSHSGYIMPKATEQSTNKKTNTKAKPAVRLPESFLPGPGAPKSPRTAKDTSNWNLARSNGI